MRSEYKGIDSIYKQYEEWEIANLDPHEPIGGSNRRTSIKYGMFMYITREYHRWLHDTHEGRIKNKEYQTEMQIKCMETHNMTEDEFRQLFGKSYL